MSETCQELIGLKNSIELILNRPFNQMTLWCNNKAAESCAKTDGGNRLRHMTELREHYVKECVGMKRVKIRWIATEYQIADVFTKPLPLISHDKCTKSIMNLN